jgi:hypothetical protein
MECESLVGPVHQMLDLEQDEQHRLPEVEADMHLTLEESRDIPLAQFAQAQLQHVMTPEVTVFEAPIGPRGDALHEWPIECQYPGLCRFLHERTPLRETNRSVEHLMEILHHAYLAVL